ncbi:MAG: ribulokinase [Anaerolineales bacterium]|nr:ribulokinase [Anaerolineales bacterium]
MSRYVIGVDFGTESGRAILVDTADGREIASDVYQYSNGVIDERLPSSDQPLETDWALQDPQDYLRTFQNVIPNTIKKSGINPENIIGIGIDFTACTMLPTTADGTPLCFQPEWKDNPHAWVKLWKHHAAQPEADLINSTAREMGEPWLERYGGKISSEWFFSKVLQIVHEAPEVYKAADRMIEAADWVVWQLTGVETRNSCTAGYKAIWSKSEGFPSKDYFKALHPMLENVVDEKMSRDIRPAGQKAGGLSPQAAEWTGLKPGTAVAVANVDAHVAVPAVTVTEAGRMVMIMGTSTCHMVLGKEEHLVPGICGYVEDGIIPDFFGYEAGQSCVGDHFAWFVENCVPGSYDQEAEERGIGIHALLEEKASRYQAGETGLVALDWWNGNRSVLVDVDLAGVLVGMTLATKPEEIYRALIEATAFGTRVIVEAFQQNGVPIHELVACGGLPEKNSLLMQIYSDVMGMPFKVSASAQTPALGSAMFGAVAAGKAAGGYDSIYEAAQAMASLKEDYYKPDMENHAVYNRLYTEYIQLHDYFGRGANDVLKRLKALKGEVLADRTRKES